MTVCGLGVLAHGQRGGAMTADGPVHHATYVMATGELIVDAETPLGGPCEIVWANTDLAGAFVPAAVNVEEWLDWGEFKPCGSDIICAFSFAYTTTVIDTTCGGPNLDLCVNFYDDVVGQCSDAGLGLVPDETFCFTNLPASCGGNPVTWIIRVDLAGGFEFQLDRGSFGFSFVSVRGDGSGGTGPSLCFAGDGAGGKDANGQENLVSVYTPDLTSGLCAPYGFGGPPNDYGSFYLELEGPDTSNGPWAEATYTNDPGLPNPYRYIAVDPPVLGRTYRAAVVLLPGDNTAGLWVCAGCTGPPTLPPFVGV